ncbi:MAG: MG2 domain-containing protein, partial [Prevotellaceae bacterium]|nr:MG2 domain-containing protein [Prevotellaceae bacterium]
ELRNIPQLTVTVYKTSVPSCREDFDMHNAKDIADLKKRITGTAFTTTKTFYGHTDYDVFNNTIEMGNFATGAYLIECSAPKMDAAYELLYVSDISIAYQSLPQGKTRIAVLNARTGEPVGGAQIDLKYGNTLNAVKETLTADENGEITVGMKDQSLTEVYAYTKTDKYSLPLRVSGTYRFYGSNPKTKVTRLYTDRAIYRPGQTVKASAIVFTREGDSTKVVCRENVKFVLRDANYEVVEEKSVKTDDYGTAAADFVLPKKVLTGNFTLHAENAFESIRVEEYKRPTFEIVFPEITKKYQNGDTLLVHTKVLTFAGAPVQNAKVKYQIVRHPAYWSVSSTAAVTMSTDSATTDANGAFWLKMNLDLPKGNSRAMYNFVATVTATSLNGETHEGSLTVPLGYKQALLEVNLPQQIERDSLRTMTFSMKNAAGRDVDAEVRYWFDNGEEHTCQTQQQIAIVPQLESGRHELTAICEDDTLKQNVLVLTEDDTKPCCTTKDWFWVSSSTFPRNGKPVTVQVGSSDENLHILYSIFAKDKVIEQGSVEENASLLNRKFLYKE